MRSYVAGISLAILAAGPVLAQQQENTDQQVIAQRVQVPGIAQAYQLQPQEMAEVAGVYVFDNGGVFRMTRVGHRLMAQLGERTATELVAVSANRFVSRDQAMTVDYLPQAFGDQITLRYPSNLAHVDAPMVTVRLARN